MVVPVEAEHNRLKLSPRPVLLTPDLAGGVINIPPEDQLPAIRHNGTIGHHLASTWARRACMAGVDGVDGADVLRERDDGKRHHDEGRWNIH